MVITSFNYKFLILKVKISKIYYKNVIMDCVALWFKDSDQVVEERVKRGTFDFVIYIL